MNTSPSLVVIATEATLTAYRLTEGSAVRVDTMELRGEVADISDAGNATFGTVSSESNLGTWWTDGIPSWSNSDEDMAEKAANRILETLADEPGTWGLAAPDELNRRILDRLPASLRARLATNLMIDLGSASPSEIAAAFSRSSAAF